MPKPNPKEQPVLTQHIGYGRFQLQDFEPGELFARFDSSLALVCDPQPKAPLSDRILVWVDHGTSNARREWLHRTALAYAVSEAQAMAIERRRQEDSEVRP
jgi:hypothetical protein